jgi:hypothetical protein
MFTAVLRCDDSSSSRASMARSILLARIHTASNLCRAMSGWPGLAVLSVEVPPATGDDTWHKAGERLATAKNLPAWASSVSRRSQRMRASELDDEPRFRPARGREKRHRIPARARRMFAISPLPDEPDHSRYIIRFQGMNANNYYQRFE